MELTFWITAFIASLLGTIASFGISTILLPVTIQIYTYQNAIAITSIFHLFGNLGRIRLATGQINTKLVARFGIPAVLATLMGAYSIKILNTSIGETILGIILITYSTLGLLKLEPRIKTTLVNTTLGGALYGYLSGFVGTGGPLRGVLLLGYGLEKEEYIATSGAISLLIDLTRVPAYLFSGYLSSQYYAMVPFMLVVALAGSSASKIIHNRLQPKVFSIIAASNLVEKTQFMSDFKSLMDKLAGVAVVLLKICNDLMLLSSGPKTGLNETHLPRVEPYSSIMPGKINPSILESTNMVCFQVLGNRAVVEQACSSGVLELNVYTPVIAHNICARVPAVITCVYLG
ncbi:MAG: TSUP family transporter [Deltaproteobacteria bacterium]